MKPKKAQTRAGEADEARSDRELVYAARDGDTRAFDALFYRHRDGIFRLGLAITKDPSAADEIVVDTFARAHRALARLEPDDSLRPWLYRVAVNLSYNRRPRKGVVLSPLEDAVGAVKSRLHYALRRLRTHLSAHPELGLEPRAAFMASPGRQRTAPLIVEPVRLDRR